MMRVGRKRILRWAILIGLLLVAANSLYFSYRSRTGGRWRPRASNDAAGTPPEGALHDKWIVVTTVAPPTEDVKRLAALDGWKLVVVGDLKTPRNWTLANCIYLGVEEQQRLGYRITELLPYHSYTRKNVGYLYAIRHGARYIYDTDDDNHPKTGGDLGFRLGANTSGLIYDRSSGDTMNPCAHFGQPYIWSRGYPLNAVNVPNDHRYTLCHFRTPAVQQGMVDGDPDVDAIYRLTRKDWSRKTVNVTFDARAPPVTLPRGVFAPYNSQNTLFAYGALWSLFLPATVAFRVTDIWRGYWGQRLLWLLGHRVAFFPPNAVQVRNAHDYLEDLADEAQLHRDAERLVQFLKRWECAHRSFFGCVSDLGRQMATAGFWGASDADAVERWLDDLRSVGYLEPEMEPRSTSDCHADSPANAVLFHAVRQDGPKSRDRTGVTLSPSVLNLHQYCDSVWTQTVRQSAEQTLRARRVYDGHLLVVVFNLPHLDNVHLLDSLYGEHFANILYCGQVGSFADLVANMSGGPSWVWRQRDVSFVNVTMVDGYLGYECAVRAIQMGYGVDDGYLVVGDDVLFNFWNYDQFSPWRRPAHQAQALWETPTDRADNHTWHWWYSPWGARRANPAFDELLRLAADDDDERSPLVRLYFDNRRAKGLNDSLVQFGISDLYFVPAPSAAIFAAVASVFLRHRVFLEIAVPTTLLGLSTDEANIFWGRILWSGTRRYTFLFFNETHHYLHPLKLSEATGYDLLRKEYCELYIRAALRNW